MRHFRAARKILFLLIGVVFSVFVWDVSMGLYALKKGFIAEDATSRVENLWEKKQWGSMSGVLSDISASLQSSQNALRRIVFVSRVPFVGQELAALRNIVGASAALARGGHMLAGIAASSLEPILGNTLDTSKLSERDRRALQATLTAAIPQFDRAAQSFSIARTLVRRVPSDAALLRIPPIRRVYDLIADTAIFFDEFEPFIALLPRIGGFFGEREYLLLFQNNTELRPTGGFIGTYGIVRIRNGNIISLTIDDAYNLDRSVPAKSRPPAPKPLQDYLGQPYWFFRDVSWSPDFPETAERAIRFYREEGGTARPHGVIALTTQPVVDLLQITGPVRVGKREFAADTVVAVLQSAVERDYYQEGIPESERKAIVGDLSTALMMRLNTLSPYELRDVAKLIRRNLDEKHILLYDTDSAVERLVVARNWDGGVRRVNGDYVLVVETNLGSLKTDPVVARSIDYAVSIRSDGKYVATARVTYRHAGTFNWKTTRLRNYVRIYTPEGSRLVNWSGFTGNGSRQPTAPLSTAVELNKTVFAGFVSIEPGETRTISVSYLLPDRVVRTVDGISTYSLYMQKQPGASTHTMRIQGPSVPATEWSPRSLGVTRSPEGVISWETVLAKDQEFSLAWPHK